MIEPTVGRIVWFHAGGHETVMQSDQPLAAIVTYVHERRHVDGTSYLINLAVFGKEGSLWSRPHIHLWDDDGEAPARGSYARWMDDARPIAEADQNAPKREQAESDDAYKDRVDKWYDDNKQSGSGENFPTRRDPSKRADGQAHTNVDHGPPRSWGQSPNAGGPLAIDDHEPKPGAPDKSKAASDAKADADKQAAADENKADKSAKTKADKSKADDAKSDG